VIKFGHFEKYLDERLNVYFVLLTTNKKVTDLIHGMYIVKQAYRFYETGQNYFIV